MNNHLTISACWLFGYPWQALYVMIESTMEHMLK